MRIRLRLDRAHERIQTGAVERSLIKRLDRPYELPRSSPDGVGDRVGCAPGFGYEEEDQLFCAFGHLQRERLILVFRSEEHTSELQSLMRISYAVFCLKKKK